LHEPAPGFANYWVTQLLGTLTTSLVHCGNCGESFVAYFRGVTLCPDPALPLSPWLIDAHAVTLGRLDIFVQSRSHPLIPEPARDSVNDY
jgi:hypothetical protein